MSDRRFLDTNVLVYSIDDADPARQKIAATLVEEEIKAGTLTVSLQVLLEFYVAATQKLRRPIAAELARAAVARYMMFDVFEPTRSTLLSALELRERHSLSVWDAMIVASAKEAACGVLVSEDMTHGAQYGGVRVTNPFRKAQA